MRKTISKYYSYIFPKPNGGEYTSIELIIRLFIWGVLITLFIYLSINIIQTIKEKNESVIEKNIALSFCVDTTR